MSTRREASTGWSPLCRRASCPRELRAVRAACRSRATTRCGSSSEAGDSTVAGPQPTTNANPTGGSSPLLTALLEFHFSAPIQEIGESFALGAADHRTLALGSAVVLSNADGDHVTVSMLANLPDFLPGAPVGGVRNSNPFALDRVDDVFFVADAGLDGIWRVDGSTGRAKLVAFFPPLPNPLPFGPPVSQVVPTSVRALSADVVLVSFLSGFPFATGNAGVRRVWSTPIPTSPSSPSAPR